MTAASIAGTRLVGVLDEKATAKLRAFRALLLRWNQRMNLVARGDEPRLVTRHLNDALTLEPRLKPGRILDVGTGAGLPGIPLAIARPVDRFVLLDRSERRMGFVRQVVIELELTNVEVVTADIREYRAEPLFDTVVTRAVAPVERILPVVWPFVVPGGRALLQVGEDASERRAFAVSEEVAPARYEKVAVDTGEARQKFIWVVDKPAAGK